VIAKTHSAVSKAAWNALRLICFVALLVLNDAALLATYRRCFGVPMDTFRREARRLRRTARYIDAVLHGNYRRCLHLMDSDLE